MNRNTVVPKDTGRIGADKHKKTTQPAPGTDYTQNSTASFNWKQLFFKMVVHLFRWWHTWNNSPNTSLTPAWLVGWVGDKGHQAGRSSGRAPAHTQRLTPTHTHTHTKKKQLNKRPQNIVDHNTHTENQAEFEHFFTGKGQLPAALKDFPVVWPVLSDF